MEQPKQELERLVTVLEERSDKARGTMVSNLLAALGLGAGTGVVIYISGFFPPLSGEKNMMAGLFYFGASGAMGITSLARAAKGVLDYHRRNLLNDRIAEIEQSPEYKAQQGSGQKG